MLFYGTRKIKMNDFTKEELEELNVALRVLDNSCILSFPVVHKKIQSMIDNFPKCDHRTRDDCFYDEMGNLISYDKGIYKCRHCDIIFKFLFKNGQCIGTEDLKWMTLQKKS